MFCLDTSDNMRNGDFSPTRLEAQKETVHMMFNRKLKSHPESVTGFLTMGGRHVQVFATPSRDQVEFMKALRKVRPEGKCDFVSGIKTAQLALKNRQNKAQKQRIVLFIGSPIEEDTAELTKLAAQLAMNTVAVDVVNFGHENTTNDNTEKLEAFVKAVNKNNNSHLLNVPVGPHVLSELVKTSEVMIDEQPQASSARPVAASVGRMEEEDPELAEALRISMQEENLRSSTGAPSQAAAISAAQHGVAVTDDIEEEDPELAAAIAMSMAADGGDVEMMATPATKAPATQVPNAPVQPAASSSEAEGKSSNGSGDLVSGDDLADALKNPDFLESLLAEAGVSGSDVQLDDILGQISGDADKEKDGKDNNKKQ